MLTRMPVTVKCDVFSLGVLLFRLMYGFLPFPEGEILANFNCRYTFPDETELYVKKDKFDKANKVPIYPESLKQVVRMCLVKNPNQRANIFDVAKKLSELIGDFGAEEDRPRRVLDAGYE